MPGAASPLSRSIGRETGHPTKYHSKSPCKDVTASSPNMSAKTSANLCQSPPNAKVIEETADSISTVQKECLNLINFKQYKSSEALARFELSTLLVDFQKVYNSSSESVSIAKLANALAKNIEIIADCCSLTNEPKRALHYYRQAIHYSRIASVYRGLLDGTSHIKPKNDRYVTTSKEATLRLKESECLTSMGKLPEAIEILERSFRSNSPYRTVAVCMNLGNLYLTTGKKADAIRLFIDALKQNPYTIEAIEKLAILNASKNDVVSVVSGNMASITIAIPRNQIQNKENRDWEPINRTMLSPNAPSITVRNQTQMMAKKETGSTTLRQLPLSQLVSAHFDSLSNNPKAALNTFKSLDHIYPNNIYILLNIAKLQLKSLDYYGAKETFEKVRSLDEWNLDGMDRFVALIASSSQIKNRMGIIEGYNHSLIHRISHDMLETDNARAEPWLALAIYHRMNNDFVHSLMYVDRALSCCPNYAYAHQLRGSILLSNRKPEQAIASFQRANDISCDIDSYEGLVESYLAAEKIREALFSAKEAISYYPKDPRGMSLVGLTLAYMSKDSMRVSDQNEFEKQAKKALRNGLELNPSAPRTLFKLLELYLQSQEYDKGIEILMNALDSGNDGITGNFSYTWTALNVCHLQPLSYYGKGAAVRECKDILYTKLGIVYTLNKNYMEACKALHIALSINPKNKEARRAYDHLELTMIGEDSHVDCSDNENSWGRHHDEDEKSDY